MRLNPTPTLQNPCACLCKANHPDRMGICTGRAIVIITTASGVDVHMCPTCGDAWDRGGQGNIDDQRQELQKSDPVAAAELDAAQTVQPDKS